ncbi:cyclin N-terminal domain-containing protein 1 [Pholidichthys leucotaenia]
MAKRLLFSSSWSKSPSVKFRQGSFQLITDFLINLNQKNKDNLRSLSKCCGAFKHSRVVEHVFLITKELGLDPLTGYHAVELLQRFMFKHLENLVTTSTPTHEGAASDLSRSQEDAIFGKLKDKFPLIVFSCVQLSSKLSLHSQLIDNNTAVRFLRSIGHSFSKQDLLESELMVLKGLEFRLNVPNPLTYVEILLEGLGHNEPSVPVEHLYHQCGHVLQFISLHRTDIYETLLRNTTWCENPSRKQRETFLPVTEDYMLLGVGVIAVATFILYVRQWKQVVRELSCISGISRRSIIDFVHATLVHVTGTSFLEI